jgi:tetratricopeptide (TPR) repeat protein
MCRSKAFGVLTLVTLIQSTLQPVSAADPWICMQSPNFELYTTAGEKSGREALLVFEEIRSAFKDIVGVKLPEKKPVSIIAFRDEQEYAPYRLRAGTASYYMPMPGRDFIVLQDLSQEHLPYLLHEYTHVVIHQAGMKLPVWLNEGFAEFYSTMKPVGGKILVGRVIPGRLEVAEAGLVSLREILNTGYQSSDYNETSRLGTFYAESWALVHMLKFNPRYAPKFDRLLDAIGRGDPSVQALEEVYGKPVEAIQKDLQAYVHGEHFSEGVIHARIGKPDVQPVVVPKDPLDIAVLMAGIQSHGPHRDQAIGTLENLAKNNPGRSAPLDSLAWLYLTSPNPQMAMQPFRQAFESGTRDANLCFTYAVRLRTSIPEAEYLAVLRRTTAIDPEFSAAQEILAAHAFNTRDYPEAVTRLHQVKKLGRADACMYYRALSYAAFQIGNKEEARSAAERAQKYASTAEDHRLADELTRYVTGAGPATAPPALSEPRP